MHKNPKFKNNPERYKNRVELDEIITKCFSKYSKDEIQKKLDQEGIANALLNDIADLSNTNFSK